jgi:dephospho-CoA kinase
MSTNELRVVALVGMPGSGKGTCTDFLHETYDWPIVHFGNMVYEEVQRRGLDNVRDEAFVREDMRAQEGKAVLAKHAARKANEYAESGEKVVVFDGLYSWSELLHLREVFGGSLLVIAVAAPRKIRYGRTLARNDSHRKYTSEQQVMNRDIAEIENLEKGGPIAFADYTIVNDDATENMISKLTDILKTEKII